MKGDFSGWVEDGGGNVVGVLVESTDQPGGPMAERKFSPEDRFPRGDDDEQGKARRALGNVSVPAPASVSALKRKP